FVAEKTNVSKQKEKVVVSLDSEGSGADDFSELKKITALLAKAFNQRKFYSKPTNNNLRTSSTSHDSDQEINANMVFMAQIEKVLSESDECSSSAEETIAENADLLDQIKVLKDQLQVKHVVIDTHVECHEKYAILEAERYEYMIRYSGLCDDKQHRKQIADQEVLFDKMSVQLVELDKHVKDFKNTVLEDFKISEFEGYLETFSSVKIPKHSDVIWMKKGSSNTSNVNLSSVSLSKLNKNVKRYSRKDLLSCNNSHLEETSSAYVCNYAMNFSCNSRMCDLFDDNNFFIFDDESVRISPVSKMPFRKKPRDSMNVRSKSKMNKSLPRTVHKWLPKMQPLAEPVAKWIPRVERQIDKISKTPNSSGPIYKWVPKVC
nr:hypothetical protein [Tanacetum cinerariifolium]